MATIEQVKRTTGKNIIGDVYTNKDVASLYISITNEHTSNILKESNKTIKDDDIFNFGAIVEGLISNDNLKRMIKEGTNQRKLLYSAILCEIGGLRK